MGLVPEFYPSLNVSATANRGPVVGPLLSIFTFLNPDARVSLAGLRPARNRLVRQAARPSAAPAAGSLI